MSLIKFLQRKVMDSGTAPNKPGASKGDSAFEDRLRVSQNRERQSLLSQPLMIFLQRKVIDSGSQSIKQGAPKGGSTFVDDRLQRKIRGSDGAAPFSTDPSGSTTGMSAANTPAKVSDTDCSEGRGGDASVAKSVKEENEVGVAEDTLGNTYDSKQPVTAFLVDEEDPPIGEIVEAQAVGFFEQKWKLMVFIVVVVAGALAAALLALGRGGDGRSDGFPVSDEPGAVVTTATVNICNAAIPFNFDGGDLKSFGADHDAPAALVFPFQFNYPWDTACSDDERVRQMGGLQQSLATMLHERYGGDVVVQNAGAIKGEIAAGPVYEADVRGVSPYMNTVSFVTVDGGGLAAMLNNAVTRAASITDKFNFGGAYPYCSGVRFDVDVTSVGTPPVANIEVVDAATGEWTALSGRLGDEFRVQTNSFLASGGDGYMAGVNVIRTYDTGSFVLDGVLEYLVGVVEWDVTGQEMSTMSFENGL